MRYISYDTGRLEKVWAKAGKAKRKLAAEGERYTTGEGTSEEQEACRNMKALLMLMIVISGFIVFFLAVGTVEIIIDAIRGIF